MSTPQTVFPGHPFTPPPNPPGVQATRPVIVQAKGELVTMQQFNATILRALLPPPPASQVFRVLRVTIAADRLYNGGSAGKVPMPQAVVGPAVLRLNGVEIARSDEGYRDEFATEVLTISPADELDVVWLSMLYDVANLTNNVSVASARFEVIEAPA